MNSNVLDIFQCFIDWKNGQRKIIRGGKVMFDIKGYHKYIYDAEMFDFWLNMENHE